MRAGLLLAVLLAGLAMACSDGSPEAPQPVEGATVETIPTEDGLNLDARLFAADPDVGGEARLVILLHEYPEDQTAWYEAALDFTERGISALTLDFRGYGASEGDDDPADIHRDVRAALAFARDRGYEHIVLVGASMGGTAAIVTAADEPVDGVVTLSAPARFRTMDTADVAHELEAPLAAVAAKGDLSAAAAVESFEERADLDPRWMLLVEGRAHGTELLTSPEAGEVWNLLLAFLDEVWGTTAAAPR